MENSAHKINNCIKTPPKVFISYCRESEERIQQVCNLAQALRADGIDCMIDQFIQSPSNWDRWMIDQIDVADFVLIVCSEEYYNSFRSTKSLSNRSGVTWESTLIIEQLYKYKSSNDKFYPIFLDQPNGNLIPNGLRTSFFDLSSCDLSGILLDSNRLEKKSGYQDLYRLLTKQPSVIPYDIGTLQSLNQSSENQNSQSIHSLINHESDESFGLTRDNTLYNTKKIVNDNRKIGNYIEQNSTINGSIISNLTHE